MADYQNEELAGASRWLPQNGSAAITGIVIGIVVLAGWYGWHWYQGRQSGHAADLYAQVQNAVGSDQVTGGVVNEVNTLENDYDGTPYAGAAAMTLAAYYVGQQQLDKAAKHLEWAADHAQGEGMQAIATVRLARVLWAQNQPDAALKRLDADHPASFDALYAELTGDIQMARGNRQAAHTAFEDALRHLPDNVPRQPLTEKLQASAPAGAKRPSQALSNHNATDPS